MLCFRGDHSSFLSSYLLSEKREFRKYMRHTHFGCTIDFMNKTVQIRKVPDEVHRTLRTRAAAAGVSLSDYLLTEIVRLADRPAIADVLARAESRSGGASHASIVNAVREGRDEGE